MEENINIHHMKLKLNLVMRFWSWLSENKDILDRKKMLSTIQIYKNKVHDLNELFRLDINNFF